MESVVPDQCARSPLPAAPSLPLSQNDGGAERVSALHSRGMAKARPLQFLKGPDADMCEQGRDVAVVELPRTSPQIQAAGPPPHYDASTYSSPLAHPLIESNDKALRSDTDAPNSTSEQGPGQSSGHDDALPIFAPSALQLPTTDHVVGSVLSVSPASIPIRPLDSSPARAAAFSQHLAWLPVALRLSGVGVLKEEDEDREGRSPDISVDAVSAIDIEKPPGSRNETAAEIQGVAGGGEDRIENEDHNDYLEGRSVDELLRGSEEHGADEHRSGMQALISAFLHSDMEAEVLQEEEDRVEEREEAGEGRTTAKIELGDRGGFGGIERWALERRAGSKVENLSTEGLQNLLIPNNLDHPVPSRGLVHGDSRAAEAHQGLDRRQASHTHPQFHNHHHPSSPLSPSLTEHAYFPTQTAPSLASLPNLHLAPASAGRPPLGNLQPAKSVPGEPSRLTRLSDQGRCLYKIICSIFIR